MKTAKFLRSRVCRIAHGGAKRRRIQGEPRSPYLAVREPGLWTSTELAEGGRVPMVPRQTPSPHVPPALDHFLRGFWANVEITDDCWLWTGVVADTGYGEFYPARALLLTSIAHRVSYLLHVGAIPDGLAVDHKCHVRPDCQGGPTCPHRRCVRPDHLQLLTAEQNVRRSPRRFYTEAERRPVPGIQHGRPGAYSNHKCRCDLCRSAWSAYVKERRAIRGRSDRRSA